jgi:hypothetical protein
VTAKQIQRELRRMKADYPRQSVMVVDYSSDPIGKCVARRIIPGSGPSDIVVVYSNRPPNLPSPQLDTPEHKRWAAS